MAITMNYKAYIRTHGKEPNHMYCKEVKRYRKITNRKWRKRSNALVMNRETDWDAVVIPPPPKTSGWLST